LSWSDPFWLLGPYFRPALLVWNSSKYGGFILPPQWHTFVIECVKWFIIFAVAVWLSIAQLASRRKTEPDRG
jgi:hypothetical protein